MSQLLQSTTDRQIHSPRLMLLLLQLLLIVSHWSLVVLCQANFTAELCFNGTGNVTQHCFTTLGANGKSLMSWQDSLTACGQLQPAQGHQYSLTDLLDPSSQDALGQFINQAELTPHSVWMSGKLVDVGKWSWLNGSTAYAGSLSKSENETLAAYITTADPTILRESDVSYQRRFICRLSGPICDKFSQEADNGGYWQIPSSDSTKSCYVSFPRHTSYEKSTQKWYMARNICLQQNGDLADQGILETSADRWLPRTSTDNLGHWIGLRQHRLVWVTSDTVSDIKMTYFGFNTPTTTTLITEMCMALKYSGQWVWEMRQCQGSPADGYEGLQVVCHRTGGNQPSARSTVNLTTPSNEYDPVPHLQLGQMIGIILGSVAFFVLAIVLTVLVTRCCLRHKRPCSTERYDEPASPRRAGQQGYDPEPDGCNGNNAEKSKDRPNTDYGDVDEQAVYNNWHDIQLKSAFSGHRGQEVHEPESARNHEDFTSDGNIYDDTAGQQIIDGITYGKQPDDDTYDDTLVGF